MEKSNQVIARKCASFIPRLESRRFDMVISVKNTFRILNIKASHKAALINFFNDVQQFMVDYDVQGSVVMGRNDDLFLTLSAFQFTMGPYANHSAVDFLHGMHCELEQLSVVDSIIPKTKLSDPVKPLEDPARIRNKLGIRFGDIRTEGGQLMLLRSYIPAPMGMQERGMYYTTSAFNLNSQCNKPLVEQLDKDLIVVCLKKAQLGDDLRSGPFCSYAVPLGKFLELVEEWGCEVGVPDLNGNFWIRKKSVA